MTQCDISVFYRVFCVTLLGIAFTFTVILTNVFIDIDGLLSSKVTPKVSKAPSLQVNSFDNVPDSQNAKELYNEEKIYLEEEDTDYRTKRSLESQNYKYRYIKSPKVKKILTNRLSSLLEELDTEEKATTIKIPEDVELFKNKDNATSSDNTDVKKLGNRMAQNEKDDKDLLRLAMHNILLDGIINHIDLNEIYKEVHTLTQNFNHNVDIKKAFKLEVTNDQIMPTTTTKNNIDQTTSKSQEKESDDEQFLDELSKLDEPKKYAIINYLKKYINSEEWRKEIINQSSKIENIATVSTKNETTAKPATHKEPKIFINTVIHIASNNKNNSITEEDIEGALSIVLNGKTIQLRHSKVNDNNTTRIDLPSLNRTLSKKEVSNENVKKNITVKCKERTKDSPDFAFLHQLLRQYFKVYAKNHPTYSETIHKYETKRLKRHIKVRYDEKKLPNTIERTKSNHKKLSNYDDDELFVEIKTHFNNKRLNGQKKSKLIKGLIEKIEEAIQGDLKAQNDKIKTHKKVKHWNIKKRVQNPMETIQRNMDDDEVTFESVPMYITRRQINPLSRTVNLKEQLSKEYDGQVKEWKIKRNVPGLFAVTKSINSTEIDIADGDIPKISTRDSISQRLQLPINTDNSEEFPKLGNLKFLVKSIDGSGFSVGINQFTDEPPDPESFKVFTGLENLIKTYQQKYDVGDDAKAIKTFDKMEETFDSSHAIVKRHIKNIVHSSSESKNSLTSDNYEDIFGTDDVMYDNYNEILDGNQNNIENFTKDDFTQITEAVISNSTKGESDNQGTIIGGKSFYIDDEIIKKDLRPAEIFKLASLLERKRRSVNKEKLNKAASLKSKIRTIRFLTKRPFEKKVEIKSKRRQNCKRLKRQIKIIARHPMNQDERNDFMVSNENLFADRAIVTDFERSDTASESTKSNGYMDYHLPQVEDGDGIKPTLIMRLTRNRMLSKYPHLFVDESPRYTRTEEDPEYFPINPIVPKMLQTYDQVVPSLTENKRDDAVPVERSDAPSFQNLVQDITPPDDSTNYKLTVKILPKRNSSEAVSGFKEIHTSINKSFDKNGMRFLTLLNVSEISKVENLHSKSNESRFQTTPPIPPEHLVKHLKLQQETMKSLLREQKHVINSQLRHLESDKFQINEPIETKRYDETKTLTEKPVENPTEKTTYESINNETTLDDGLVDIVLPSNPETIVRMSRKEVNKIVASALFKSTDCHTSTPQITNPTTVSPEEITTIIPATSRRQYFLDKLIVRNVNLTNEILNKIDRNTDLLAKLLIKLNSKKESIKNRENLKEPKIINTKMELTTARKNSTNDDRRSDKTEPSESFLYQNPVYVANIEPKQISNSLYQNHGASDKMQPPKDLLYYNSPRSNALTNEAPKNVKTDSSKTFFQSTT